MECVLQILRCAQNDKMTICHPERSEGSAASYKADSCRAAAGREEKGEYKKGGADPSVSDVAPPLGPAVTYSPTLPGSTIGAGGLNGSVRYG